MSLLRGHNSRRSSSGSILSREDRHELVELLCDLDDIRLDPSRRHPFVAIAGLGSLSLDYTGSGRVFAARLVEAVERVGIVNTGTETYSALSALLDYMLSLDYLRTGHKLFLTSLIERYDLASNIEHTASRTDSTGNSDTLSGHLSNTNTEWNRISQENRPRWFSRLWNRFIVVFLVPLVSLVAAISQLWALNQCSSFRVATIVAFLGGIGMLACSWLPWNRHQYENWDRLVTALLTVISTGLFAVFAFSSCRPEPPEPTPPGYYQYLITVYDAETKKVIEDALVAVTIGGQNIDGRTGNINGIARLLIPHTFRGQQAQLVVSKDGYVTYRDKAHTLIADNYEVPLTRASVSGAEEAIIAASSTATSLPTSTETARSLEVPTTNSTLPSTLLPSLTPSHTQINPTDLPTSAPVIPTPTITPIPQNASPEPVTNTPGVSTTTEPTPIPPETGTPPPIRPAVDNGTLTSTASPIGSPAMTPTPIRPGTGTPQPIPPETGTPLPIEPEPLTPPPIMP